MYEDNYKNNYKFTERALSLGEKVRPLVNNADAEEGLFKNEETVFEELGDLFAGFLIEGGERELHEDFILYPEIDDLAYFFGFLGRAYSKSNKSPEKFNFIFEFLRDYVIGKLDRESMKFKSLSTLLEHDSFYKLEKVCENLSDLFRK